jgi:outer membrane receptor protein involved in Fe transport
MLALLWPLLAPAPAATGDPAAQPEPEPPADLPELESVVHAPAPETTASERRIAGPELQSAPRRSTDDLLRLVPGLLVVQHGAEGKGHQFFLRGFDAAHGTDLEVTLDGLPLNEISNVHGHGYLDLYFIPPEAVGALHVLPGPFDLAQGDFATAGSVRLESGVAEADRGTRLSYQGGTTNRHRVAVVHAPAHSDGFLAAETVTDEGYGQDRWNRRTAFLARIDGRDLAGGPDLLLGFHTGSYGSPNAVRLADRQAGDLEFHDTYTHGLEGRSMHALVSASRTFGAADEWRAQAALMLHRFAIESNYTGWLQHPADGDFRRQDHDGLEAFASAWWTPEYTLAGRPLAVRAGVEWRGDWFEQDDALIRVPSGLPWQVERDAAGQVHHLALAAGASWSVASWLTLDLGLRGDLFGLVFTDRLAGDARHDDLLGTASPRAALRFPLSDDWTLFAAYGRGFRSPEARSVAAGGLPGEDVPLEAWRGGEPQLATSDSVETGVRWTYDDVLELSLAGFATFLDHETVFDHVSNTNLELNATRRLGGALALRWRPWSWLELHADLTGVDARFVESDNPVPGAPRLLTTFGVRFRHPCGVRAELSGFYLAPRALAHGATGAHQLALDATAAYRWRFLELRVEVENLLDADWPEGEYHFASWFDRDEPRSSIPVTHYTAGPPLELRAGLTLWL